MHVVRYFDCLGLLRPSESKELSRVRGKPNAFPWPFSEPVEIGSWCTGVHPHCCSYEFVRRRRPYPCASCYSRSIFLDFGGTGLHGLSRYDVLCHGEGIRAWNDSAGDGQRRVTSGGANDEEHVSNER